MLFSSIHSFGVIRHLGWRPSRRPLQGQRTGSKAKIDRAGYRVLGLACHPGTAYLLSRSESSLFCDEVLRSPTLGRSFFFFGLFNRV